MPNDHYSRHYYVSDSLEDLEKVEEELQIHGIAYEQFHVLTNEHSELSHHSHLHEVPSLFQRDIVKSSLKGALVGIIIAPLLLFLASLSDLTATMGFMPFMFLAVVIFAFCTWEGGFLGIQRPNNEFVRFAKVLNEGKHIFFVDIARQEESKLSEVLKDHPKLQAAGMGEASPKLMMQVQHGWREFTKVFP